MRDGQGPRQGLGRSCSNKTGKQKLRCKGSPGSSYDSGGRPSGIPATSSTSPLPIRSVSASCHQTFSSRLFPRSYFTSMLSTPNCHRVRYTKPPSLKGIPFTCCGSPRTCNSASARWILNMCVKIMNDLQITQNNLLSLSIHRVYAPCSQSGANMDSKEVCVGQFVCMAMLT